MSSRTSIVRARPPAPRVPQSRGVAPSGMVPPSGVVPPRGMGPAANLSPGGVVPAAEGGPAPSLAAFRALVAAWGLDEAAAEALLGEPVRLSPAQLERVRLLLRMDAAAPAPEWFTWPNAHPSLAGRAPAEQMARLGLPAFRRVLRVLGCG